MATFVYDKKWWPAVRVDAEAMMEPLARIAYLQGELTGTMRLLGFEEQERAVLDGLTADVVQSSAIEGAALDVAQVRSSIARRLGFTMTGAVASTRNVDAVVEMLLDAIKRCGEPVTRERILGWHAALFPTGYSGMYPVEVGRYRTGEMQVVSGAMGHERVHYVAPSPARVPAMMDEFLAWLNSDEARAMNPVLCAARAHWWFIMIHPMDDGNGRIARAISDLVLARGDASSDPIHGRAYSLSAQILVEKKQYYSILEHDGTGDGDITEWSLWFAQCLEHAIVAARGVVQGAVNKATFWREHTEDNFNERQRKVLNRLLDGFEGRLTSSKWAKLCHCSQATALNDITALLSMGVLERDAQGGRSTGYRLADFK